MKRFIPRFIHWCFNRRSQLVYALGGKVVGARALVIQQDQVLLVQHTYIEGWYTVGGMVDKNETPLEAIKRELVEEAGIHVTEDPVLFHIYQHRYQKKDDYIFFYIVKSFTEGKSSSPEIEVSRFFSLHDLPQGVSKSTLQRIKEYQGLVPIAKSWVPD